MRKPYTAKAQRALDLAGKTSKNLKHNYIGTEHILLGLMKEGTGVAAQILADNGVEEAQLLQLIKDLIAPSSSVAVEERLYAKDGHGAGYGGGGSRPFSQRKYRYGTPAACDYQVYGLCGFAPDEYDECKYAENVY